MQIPFAVLKAAGGGKAAALLAMLAGLVIVTAMKNAPTAAPKKPSP